MVRVAAFGFLDEQKHLRGEVLPREILAQGFVFEGQRVPLIGPPGIFKPALLPEMPLSITTVPEVGRKRRHQQEFRQQFAICRQRHEELLDAAHILPDGHPRGEPVVPNGLALCKLHHAAFDRHFLGVRPDLTVELRPNVLREPDGPMPRGRSWCRATRRSSRTGSSWRRGTG